jgi:hypothetical protein
MTAFPLTGPHRALGHASNVARRSAAHNCGKHATPAVVSRKTVTASSSPAPIQGWTSAPRHQGVAADRDRRAHRADGEKSVPRFRLTRLKDKTDSVRAGRSQGMSATSASFSKVPKDRGSEEPDERRLADP